jgi:mono/diheme cytochrome c family protein
MLLLCIVTLAHSQEAVRPAEQGWIDFKQPILPDPVLQHAKETYILYGCAYCHGVDLHVRNGEAADLLHSKLVGADQDGNIIVKLLKVGIPQTAKLSPMPQFSDLSDKELADITRWIHYARMQGRFTELMRADTSNGDAAAGKQYYDTTCSSCHATASMKKSLNDRKVQDIKPAVLKPAILETVVSFKVPQPDAERIEKGKSKHSSLLENYTDRDVANLLAYLNTINKRAL